MRPRTSLKCATLTEVAFLRPARSGIQQTAPRHSLATEVLLCHERREHAAADAILLRVRSDSRPQSYLKNLSCSTTGVAIRGANPSAFSRNTFKKGNATPTLRDHEWSQLQKSPVRGYGMRNDEEEGGERLQRWRFGSGRSIQSDHAEALCPFVDGDPESSLELLVGVVVRKAELVEAGRKQDGRAA
ncbi:unnamed protein product [Ixodes persulcatus]